MSSIKDCLNRNVRITDERINHIRENHPEFSYKDFDEKIINTLQLPDIIFYLHLTKLWNFSTNIISTRLLVKNGCAS